MFSNFKKNNTGISMIEVLMVIAIIGIVTSISVSIFSSLSSTQSLDKEAEIVVSYINKSRSNAINSLSNKEHGISFASSTVTIFYGTNAASPATSTVYTLSSKDKIWNVSLTNGLSNFYFYRLSGEPSATGTFEVRHSDGSKKTINIYGTGFVEVQ